MNTMADNLSDAAWNVQQPIGEQGATDVDKVSSLICCQLEVLELGLKSWEGLEANI